MGRSLDETDSYALISEYESTILFDKDENKTVWTVWTYGDATCGLISIDNDWVVVGGNVLFVWYDNVLKEVEDDDLKWIHDIRRISITEIEILTDPWAPNSAIWRFDVSNFSKTKVRDFKDYEDKEYTEHTEW